VYTAVLSSWTGIGATTLQILQLFGAGDVLAITLGALATRAALQAAPKLGKILQTGS
jgi:hypothetical protein